VRRPAVAFQDSGSDITDNMATYYGAVSEVELVRADHEPALLAFERESEILATSTPDRALQACRPAT